MITQTIQVTVDLDTITVPYTYAFTSPSSTCISFDNQSGTSSSATITTVASFIDESCLESNPVYLQLIGANGCSESRQIQIPNPCSSFAVNVSRIEDYKFQASITAPGCTETTAEWIYDDSIFNVQDSQDSTYLSTIELDLIANDVRRRVPYTSEITVNVSDCHGCEQEVITNFDICRPQVEDFVKHLQCYPNETEGYTHNSGNFTLAEPTNCSSDIDWDTLTWDLPDGFSVSSFFQRGTGKTYYSFTSDETVASGTYTGTYTVQDEYGVHSNEGVVTLVVRACTENNTITIPDNRINIDCNVVSPGNTIEINVEDELIVDKQATTVVDWSTWALVDPPTPNSPSIVLTTNTDGDHIIQYQTNAPTILNDVFAWTVCDTNGNCAQAAVYTIVECITGPTANVDADCVTCGSAVIIDVLANDTSSGPIDVNTVLIDSPPSNGVVDVNADGTITYTPNSGFEGVDTFDYTVADTLGERSAAATVTVTVICAGEDTSVEICNS